MIRRIRDLLYDQGFTISGARNKMQEILQFERDKKRDDGLGLPLSSDGLQVVVMDEPELGMRAVAMTEETSVENLDPWQSFRRELFEIRELLSPRQ